MSTVSSPSATDLAVLRDWLRTIAHDEPALALQIRAARNEAELARVAAPAAARTGVRIDVEAITTATARARSQHHRLSAASAMGLGPEALLADTREVAPQPPLAPQPPPLSPAADVEELCPITIALLDGAVIVEWCDLRGLRFDDASFAMTVSRALSEPYRALSLRWSAIDVLLARGAASVDPPPDCLIFHVSRCGSTLLSRVLGGLPGGRAISEAPLIEDLLAAEALDEPARCLAIRAAVGALSRRAPEAIGRPRASAGGPFVVKLDAWSVFDVPALTRAFPDARRIFLYRDPREVIASQMRVRGAHMIPGVLVGRRPRGEQEGSLGESVGEEAMGWQRSWELGESVGDEAFCAARLDSFARAALSQLDDRDLLVNYAELPEAISTRVLPYLGRDVSARARATIERFAAEDAKSPGLPFDPVRHGAERPVTARIEVAARRLAWSSYELLEERRLAQLRARERPC